jgi:glycosyltransferase involved in cell wall biosynthesis
VIVPARDAAATLPRALESLSRQELDGEYEVIVVDDGSRDETADLARSSQVPVTFLSQPARGPAAARNLGARHAGAPALAFCDADVYPTPGWLEAGLKALEGADIVQGMVLPDPAAPLGPFDRTIWVLLESGLFETANLFTTRKTFEEVGGFEEWIRPRTGKAMAEDMWFAYRARRGGARSTFCEHALAYHAVFHRGWCEYALERKRLEYFPAMAAKIPELRRTFLYRRVFLNARTARLDLALLGGALALATGSPVPVAAAIPYLRAVRAASRRGARTSSAGHAAPPPPAVAAADIMADLIGLAAMAIGSARFRSLVI